MLSNILHFLTSNLSKNLFKLSLFSIILGFSFDVGAQEEVASAVSERSSLHSKHISFFSLWFFSYVHGCRFLYA